MENSTRIELKNIGLITKGFEFTIIHSDGFVAKETVSKIVQYIEETKDLVGKGHQQHYQVCKKIYTIIVCESCASYDLKTIEELTK